MAACASTVSAYADARDPLLGEVYASAEETEPTLLALQQSYECAREDDGDAVVDAQLRFVNDVDTWESFRQTMQLFLRGELAAHYTHSMQLTPDFEASRGALIALNEEGGWISVNGQPPLPCDVLEDVLVRRAKTPTHLPLLTIQRPYIVAYVPSEQVARLLQFCATHALCIRVNAAILRPETVRVGVDWLTVERFLQPTELQALRASSEEEEEVFSAVAEMTGEEEEEEEDNDEDPERVGAVRYYTKFRVFEETAYYFEELPPKLIANAQEQGKYMKVEIYSRMTSLRLTDLLLEQFVRA